MARALSQEELLERFDNVSEFYEGLAVAQEKGADDCVDSEWFHIHPDGTIAYEERFDLAYHFEGGLALVMVDNEWFHIRPDGRPAYEERFGDCGRYIL